MAKILIVYYSRTGTTKKVAQQLQERLQCDAEEIVSIKNRSGVVGYFISGKEATQKVPAEIGEMVNNPADYDMVIVGTPVWAWNISSPVRAYLEKNKEKFKRLAAFCTMSGDGDRQSYAEIEKICNKKLDAQFALKTKDVHTGNGVLQIEKFISDLHLQ